MALKREYTLPTQRVQAFDMLYKEQLLGAHETVSGIGSTLMATSGIRDGLASLSAGGLFTSIVDIGCGDFNWMSMLAEKGIAVTGVDIVDEVIADNRRRWGKLAHFVQMDAVAAVPPQADLALCRDVFTHLPPEDVACVINHIRQSGARFLAATSYDERLVSPKMQAITAEQMNGSATPGYWRGSNLCRPPFHLPPPFFKIAENQAGKTLDIWPLERIPAIDVKAPVGNPVSLKELMQYRFFQQLTALLYVEAIALQGSRARLTHRPDSDIDLIIYGDGPLSFEQKLAICNIVDRADTPLYIDLSFAHEELSIETHHFFARPVYVRG